MTESLSSRGARNSKFTKSSPPQALVDDSNAPTLMPQSREPLKPETLKSSHGSSVAGSRPTDGEQQVEVGTELGYYRLSKKLGEGGMGSVWQAIHTKLDKELAVKVLPATWSRDPALLTRFEREMKAVGKLEHPNIVRAMDAGEFHGTHYLVMEFNEGLDLSAYVKQRGPQSVTNACEMLRHAALGLAHAHEAGLIHRDIKPSNLFLTKTGKVKILDLGLARVQGDTSGGGQTLTGFGQVLGTPDYMAPEQWENTHSVDGRSDLYALGCTLFYLLTGRAPFSDEKHSSLVGKMKGHTLDPIPDLKAARESAVADRPKLIFDLISDELDALYRKLMAKSPDERFASATELTEALSPFGKQSASAAISAAAVKGRDSVAESSAFLQRPESIAARAESSKIMKAKETDHATRAAGSKSETRTLAPHEPTEISDERTVSDPQEGLLPNFKDVEPTIPTRKTSRLGKGESKKAKNRVAIVIAVCLLGVAILTGIIIKITNKDGTVTEIKVPEGSKIEIVNSSDPRPSPVAPQPAGWHGWPSDAPPPAIAPFDAEQAQHHQEAWAKYLGVPVEYTNSLGMKFRLIPPGEFTMGSTTDEIEEALKFCGVAGNFWQESIESEAPQRKVILTQPIYFGVHEVTQAEYEKVIGVNPSAFALMGKGKEQVAGMDTSNHPVESVSWYDAIEFCAKLSQFEKLKPFHFRTGNTVTPLDGTGFRLATEAEWEFACRAGTTTKSWIGNNDDDVLRAGWFGPNSGNRTHAVGELKSNPFGLYDVHGNVWEWVQDGWEPGYYQQFADKVGIDPSGTASANSVRVCKGGHWHHSASPRRSASRCLVGPAYGFRVALSVDAVRESLKLSGPALPKRPKASVTEGSTSSTAKQPRRCRHWTSTRPIRCRSGSCRRGRRCRSWLRARRKKPPRGNRSGPSI